MNYSVSRDRGALPAPFAAKLYAKLADSLRLFETLAKNYSVSHSKAVSTPSQNAGDELFRFA